MSSQSLPRFLLRRWWILVGLTAIAGVTAWLGVRDSPVIYQRTVSVILRPSSAAQDVADAVRVLGSSQGDVARTVAFAIGGDRFLADAATEALGGAIPSSYSVATSLKPGTEVIDIRLRGPDPQALEKLAVSLFSISKGWVDERYPVFTIEEVASEAPAGPVLPKEKEAIAIAVFAAALLWFGISYIEWRTRRNRASDMALAREELRKLSPEAPGVLVRRLSAQQGGMTPPHASRAAPEPDVGPGREVSSESA